MPEALPLIASALVLAFLAFGGYLLAERLASQGDAAADDGTSDSRDDSRLSA